jgi:UDP-N-acetylglucosamine 2-epimerase
LITAHRRENFGDPMKRIFQALRQIALENADDCVLVYPVHLNPNVRTPAFEMLGQIPNVLLIDPLDYLSMVHIMKRAHLVLTDSGGLQEEAPALGTPVLVLREVTERPEAIEAGTARLVGTQTETILDQARLLLNDPAEHSSMAKAVNPYGDGHAAERIVDSLLNFSTGD